MVRCMVYSIRTAYFLKKNGTTQDADYIKQIYLKNKQWNPPPASMEIEDSITRFETSLKHAHRCLVNKTGKKNLQNLSFSQLSTLKLLKENKNLTIKPTEGILDQQ